MEGDESAILTRDQNYSIQFGAYQLEYELLDVDESGATLYYTEIINSPGEFEIRPSVTRIRCKMYVSFADDHFLGRKTGLWPRPSDFAEDWTVGQYMEFTTGNPPYRLPTDDYYKAIIKADHRMAGEPFITPYELWVTVSNYDSKEIAREAYDEDEARLASLHDPAHSVLLASRLQKYRAYCYYDYVYTCSYVGQWDNYVLGIDMSIPHGRLPGISVPLGDWNYVVSLVESRAINGNP